MILLLHKPGVWDSFSISDSRRRCTDVEFTGKGNILESKLIAFPCTFSINKGISTLDMSPALYLKALQGSLWYNAFIVFCFLVFDKLSKDFCNCISFSQAWTNWFPWNRFNPMNIHSQNFWKGFTTSTIYLGRRKGLVVWCGESVPVLILFNRSFDIQMIDVNHKQHGVSLFLFLFSAHFKDKLRRQSPEKSSLYLP